MRHSIKKQVFELKLSADNDMFRMQEKASQYYYSHIVPALEKLLDGLTDADHVLRIDRVEIDLGAVEWKEAQQEMSVTNLYEKIEKETRKQVEQIRAQHYAVRGHGKGLVTLEKPLAYHACEQWLYYMQNGYLPWSIPAAGDAWRTQVLQALATDYQLIADTRLLIKTDSNALQRLVYNHPVSFLVKLTEVLTAQEQQSLPGLVKELEQVLYPNQHTTERALEKPPGSNTGLLWQQVLKEAAAGLSSAELVKRIAQNHLREQDLQSVKGITDMFSEETGDHAASQGPAGERTGKFSASAGNENGKQDSQAGDKTGNDNQLPQEGIFAPYAGLVLLHPFFKSLFARIGLMEDGRFGSRQQQEKAIWLLHYAATGKTEAEEYQLAVPKILCAYPLLQSTGAAIMLTGPEKTEVLDMMAAAVDRWAILKNTSADGLREGFLQRSGKIYQQNGNLCFAVEQHAIDMLLDHLPWNLSIVKLPWIKSVIRVEWR